MTKSTSALSISNHHRPRYHYLPPHQWLNDPNGLIHWRGRYHLFFQFNPFDLQWGNIHWGHAVSDDLVHWEHLPPALAPKQEEFDEFGCFSGCMVVHEDTPTIFYTGTQPHPVGTMPYAQHTNIALPLDDELLRWRKYEGNPVIRPPQGLDLIGFRDHCVWREGDQWLQMIGSGIKDVGGAILLFRSHDFYNWEYLHPLYAHEGLYLHDVWVGTMWECPQLLRFGEQRVLVVSVNHEDDIIFTMYLTGRYENHRFIPDHVNRLDYGGRYFYAPQALIDDQGRTIMWGWIPEARDGSLQKEAGFAGIMSLPRQVTLRPDGRLAFNPVPELQRLRRDHQQFTAETASQLAIVKSHTFEMIAIFQPAAERLELKIGCAPDGNEYTTIFYDPQQQLIGIDPTHSTAASPESHDLTILQGPLVLAEGEALKLHLFVDHSVIELFINDGRETITGRMYPTHPKANGLVLSPTAVAALQTIDCWQLDSIW